MTSVNSCSSFYASPPAPIKSPALMGHDHQPSKLYLIRHGETVDNVKGLYAGVRDSVLTVYGEQQTQRLGEWLARNRPALTHIFSSDLVRAFKTAEAVRTAQRHKARPDVQQLVLLQEQNFGHLEGKPWSARSRDEKAKEKQADNGVETRDAMEARADAFLNCHLLPILRRQADDSPVHVAVVSHGMMLSALWRRLLKKQSAHTVSLEKELVEQHRPLALEHIGAWSNTGYLELDLTYNDTEERGAAGDGMSIKIMGIDQRAHLAGLKRSRGGIGSSAFDEQQRSITSFFKKPRSE